MVNRSLGEVLRCIAGDNPTEWDFALPQAEFAYNNAINWSIRFSSFQIVNGASPQLPSDLTFLPPIVMISPKARWIHDRIGKAITWIL